MHDADPRRNMKFWCIDCKSTHEPTKEHPLCDFSSGSPHLHRMPADIYFEYRGWRFTPPFFCMACGIEVCWHQWAFSRSCGACDVSNSRTARVAYRKCFAGPHTKLADHSEKRGDITEDWFLDPAKRFEYPILNPERDRRFRKDDPIGSTKVLRRA